MIVRQFARVGSLSSSMLCVCIATLLLPSSLLAQDPAPPAAPAPVLPAAVTQDTVKPVPVAAISHAKALSRAFRYAAETASPAVVTVLARTATEAPEPGFLLRPDGSVQRIQTDPDYDDEYDASSVGSGIIIHVTGVVLTNAHVIAEADEVIVRFSDGREFETTDIKRDQLSDVAMMRLKMPPNDLVFAKMGDSDKLEIGDWVIAIGSPFELEATVSAGIISGKGRGIDKIKRGKLLQTDAAINPGNSGGPLVNLDGEIVGLNTAIASSSGGYQGIGFAIPINHARWVLTQLAKHGKVRRSYVGVVIESMTPREAVKIGLPPISSVVVKSITAGTPAADAGLRAGDVVLSFANAVVRDSRDLQNIVERQEPGTRHPMRIYRNGEQRTLTVEVQLLPSSR